jgi:hypothetical protein
MKQSRKQTRSRPADPQNRSEHVPIRPSREEARHMVRLLKWITREYRRQQRTDQRTKKEMSR